MIKKIIDWSAEKLGQVYLRSPKMYSIVRVLPITIAVAGFIGFMAIVVYATNIKEYFPTLRYTGGSELFFFATAALVYGAYLMNTVPARWHIKRMKSEIPEMLAEIEEAVDKAQIDALFYWFVDAKALEALDKGKLIKFCNIYRAIERVIDEVRTLGEYEDKFEKMPSQIEKSKERMGKGLKKIGMVCSS